MRILILIMLAAQLLQSCKSHNHLVNQLYVCDEKINTIIDSVFKTEKEYRILNENNYGILRIKGKNPEKYTVRLSILSKSTYSRIIRNLKKDVLIGYVEYLDIPVIIYGEDSFGYFRKTKRVKKFSFMKLNNKRIKNKYGIPPPPHIFDPQVWYYSIDKDTIILKHHGVRTTIVE